MVVLEALEPNILQRREYDRAKFTEPCFVKTANRTQNAIAKNLSKTGICVQLQGLGALDRGEEVQLVLMKRPPICAIVCWTKDRKVGLKFLDSPTFEAQIESILAELTAESALSLDLTDVDLQSSGTT